jgi:hypothetical protein
VHYLLDNHKDEWIDPEAARTSWGHWAATHPLRVDDVVDKPKWEWPGMLLSASVCVLCLRCAYVCLPVVADGCRSHDRDLPGELKKSVTTFAETIEYRNCILACRLGTAQVEQNVADYGQRTGRWKPMSKGTFLWVKRDAENSNVRSNI